jgi:hypothetical protein
MTKLRASRSIVLLAGLAPVFAQDAPGLKLEPAHRAFDVDVQRTRQLIVTFDQDMDRTVHGVCGGGPSFPKVLGTAWRDARTFVIETELQAERVYALELAGTSSHGFRTATGQPLAPTPWLFATPGPALEKGVAEQAVARLFAALRDQYSYRDRLGVDWNDLALGHRDELLEAPHLPALALRMQDLLATAQDPHIAVCWMEATLPTWRPEVAANFDLRGLQMVLPKLERIGRIGWRARTGDGIGYLCCTSFAREQRDDFDLVLEALRGLRDCKALVLDVRPNGGGDEMLARRLAAFFVPGEKVYAGHRVRDARQKGGFAAVQQRTVLGNPEPDVYRGPVAVLMGPRNLSSCEAFLLMMRQAPRAVLIGATSYGSSGNPQTHLLVPGLSVQLPSWQALRPDGTCFEGEGIEPMIPVAALPAQLAVGDPVLDEALLRLRGSH